MNKKPVETIMGIVVVVVAAFFLYFAYRVSDLQVVKGYEVTAKFLKVGGLNVGSDVRINGIKVGTVIAQKLDNALRYICIKLIHAIDGSEQWVSIEELSEEYLQQNLIWYEKYQEYEEAFSDYLE